MITTKQIEFRQQWGRKPGDAMFAMWEEAEALRAEILALSAPRPPGPEVVPDEMIKACKEALIDCHGTPGGVILQQELSKYV